MPKRLVQDGSVVPVVAPGGFQSGVKEVEVDGQLMMQFVRFLCVCIACVFLGVGAMLWLLTYAAHRRQLERGEGGLGLEWVICWVPFVAASVFLYLALVLR